jgi:hypothetical protein
MVTTCSVAGCSSQERFHTCVPGCSSTKHLSQEGLLKLTDMFSKLGLGYDLISSKIVLLLPTIYLTKLSHGIRAYVS